MLKSKIQMIIDKKRKNGQTSCNGITPLTPTATESSSCKKEISSINHLCAQCNQKFDNYNDFYAHIINNIHCIKLLKNFCSLCEQTIPSLDSFKDHLIQHTIKRAYFCNICNETEYLSMISQMDHIYDKYKKYFICNYCGYIDTNLYKLKMHTHLQRPLSINNHSPKTYSCSICERLFDNEIDQNHHIKHQSYQCDKCVYRICNWNDFIHHVECMHTINLSLLQSDKCKFCPKTFNHIILLQYHQQTHRLIQCLICHKNFSCDLDLNEHINVSHKTKQLEYNDDSCQRQCRIDELDCTYCDDSFVTQSALNQHLETEHNDTESRLFDEIDDNINCEDSIDPIDNIMSLNYDEKDDILPVFDENDEKISQQFYCKMCDYVADEYDIINHIKTMHKICAICETPFATVSDCRNHMLLEHYS